MLSYYNIFLFAITFLGGSIPLWGKKIEDNNMKYLLAFSGSFLLSITFLHLLPETFEELNTKAGLFLLLGFFIQLLIQRLTHGAEHGHTHIDHNHGHDHKTPLASILLGLSIHAFMEGLPLGFNYREIATEPSLYMAVAIHKLPEAMLVAAIVNKVSGKKQAIITLALFSMITPFSGMIATKLGMTYQFMSNLVLALIPVVAGAFIHIATTIFFESGTKHHTLTIPKIIAIVLGVGIGLLTLLFE
ncbi:MAG: ZIP family metal transporter [Flavipsychrobacter sp.]